MLLLYMLENQRNRRSYPLTVYPYRAEPQAAEKGPQGLPGIRCLSNRIEPRSLTL